ncbi:ThiF family adenylyltransferase [Sporosalibacterium faouarense]|uniref:ThiF family adenylyltransferase n=1 Tax=Sporosalibacterium faouarense TaxID=516123 RepID=UPI00192B8E0E|nr:ThiF family adenylyltransferase [Sporosalibacterium faouarense]
MNRYEKQILFAEIGEEGQERLKASKVIVIGCGALGTVICNSLVRAGVGYIKIVDRDYIEISNLQRQTLFDEKDIADHLPKSIAAKKKLELINSEIIIESEVIDVNSKNIEKLCKDMDLILDATDNFILDI